MSSSQSLKHFIRERLNAAAEEIFAEFDKTIVQYEEEIDRQRKLLEICWKPQVKLQRIDLPQHYLWNNQEDLSEQQIYNQEKNSDLHQEEPEWCQMTESLEDVETGHMQEKQEEQELCLFKEGQGQQQLLEIKGEQEELRIGLEVEQLELKQMSNNFMKNPTHEEKIFREPEPNVDRLLVQTSSDAENQSQEGIGHHDTKTRTETLQNKGRHQIRGQNDDVDSLDLKRQNKTNMIKNLSSCKICGKSVVWGTLTDHMRTHTGEKPFPCLTCGKKFSQKGTLLRHIKIHTGEKPFPCLTCGKRFSLKDTLFRHVKIHTGEKSYSCSVCGKSFIQRFNLTRHVRTHTRQRPVSFSCLLCGQEFSERKSLFHHSRNHT